MVSLMFGDQNTFSMESCGFFSEASTRRECLENSPRKSKSKGRNEILEREVSFSRKTTSKIVVWELIFSRVAVKIVLRIGEI